MISLIPQRMGDLLVEEPLDHLLHDLGLTRREGPGEGFECGHTRALGAARPIPIDRDGDRVQHVLIAERLGQKIERAGLHGLDTHGNVAVTGHEDDRHAIAQGDQLRLQIEAAGSGQPDIQNQAARAIRQGGGEQVVRRSEGQRIESDRPEQVLQAVADALVILDDDNQGSGFGGGSRP